MLQVRPLFLPLSTLYVVAMSMDIRASAQLVLLSLPLRGSHFAALVGPWVLILSTALSKLLRDLYPWYRLVFCPGPPVLWPFFHLSYVVDRPYLV